MGMGAGGNGNNHWEWEGNGDKTRLNLGSGMGMGMHHWEWEGDIPAHIYPIGAHFLLSSHGYEHMQVSLYVCSVHTAVLTVYTCVHLFVLRHAR